jgi:hypothetical protein
LSWIGDSFPDTLDKRLTSVGFLTLSRDDRVFAYEHLGLPEGFKPSRATAIKIAQQLDANFIIIGSFNVTQPAGTTADGTTTAAATANESITIQAQVLSVDDLTLSAPVQGGANLDQLYSMQRTAIAWKIAHALDPHFNIAEQTFLAVPGGSGAAGV